ncbi:hypothetical protein ES702_06729 [subsurface metagenome]
MELTEKNLRKIADQGKARILQQIEEAKIRMRDPAYRKLNFDFLPGEEDQLLDYLKKN